MAGRGRGRGTGTPNNSAVPPVSNNTVVPPVGASNEFMQAVQVIAAAIN